MADVKGKIGVTTENIFPVIKQFLYSDHEIFLRELVANAVDASEKMKALAASGDFKGELGELAVRVELDENDKTLKIIDNGIGMTSEEVDRYINQIAFSSAGEFLLWYPKRLPSRHCRGRRGPRQCDGAVTAALNMSLSLVRRLTGVLSSLSGSMTTPQSMPPSPESADFSPSTASSCRSL